MLDAVKHLNFWLLFDKLITKSVPLFIVRILTVWYTHQHNCIRWGNAYSPSFSVSNGVKQGRILSPFLFYVCIDDLSVSLNSSNIGGPIRNISLNHLYYNNDLCLITLSSAGIQKLLGMFSKCVLIFL